MTPTSIIQQKLADLGYPNVVSGYITPSSDMTSDTRRAIAMFNTNRNYDNGGYINSNFLKSLDATYNSNFPSSQLPVSYYAGWNKDLQYKTSSGTDITTPVHNADNTPDDEPSPDITDISHPDNYKLYAGIAGAVLLFFMLNKKKKRNR